MSASSPDGGAQDLSYNQAQAALELVLAELQARDLDVEAMAGLYRRGQAYAQRCEAILEQVEQEVLLWDGLQDPEGLARPPEQPLSTAPHLDAS
ncbi:MAG: exodeoxyribonuclease VII small subunit [Prochlorococcaceae cyanobacterium]